MSIVFHRITTSPRSGCSKRTEAATRNFRTIIWTPLRHLVITSCQLASLPSFQLVNFGEPSAYVSGVSKSDDNHRRSEITGGDRRVFDP
jgi:hypothetical protein